MSKQIYAALLLCTSFVSAPAIAKEDGQLLSGAAQEAVRANVASGGTMLIGPFASVSQTCSSLGVADARILSRPRHGLAAINHRFGGIAFGGGHHLAYCNDRPIYGTVLQYTPARNFVGTDRFAFRLVFPNGEVRTKWVSVVVRPNGRSAGTVREAAQNRSVEAGCE